VKVHATVLVVALAVFTAEYAAHWTITPGNAEVVAAPVAPLVT